MKQYALPEFEQTGGLWRKIAKVLLVVVVFLVSFGFAFFKIGPWVKELRSSPQEAVLSDAAAATGASQDVESSSSGGPSESRVWVVPHTEPGPGPSPEATTDAEQEPSEAPADESSAEGPSEEAEPQLDEEDGAEVEPSLPPRVTETFYRVQLGVFAERERAEELSDELVSSGYSTYITQTQTDGQVQYKVQVGAFEDKSNARALASELKEAGYDVVVTSSSG